MATLHVEIAFHQSTCIFPDRNSDGGGPGRVGGDGGGTCWFLRVGPRAQTPAPRAHAHRPCLLSHCNAAAWSVPRRPSGAQNG